MAEEFVERSNAEKAADWQREIVMMQPEMVVAAAANLMKMVSTPSRSQFYLSEPHFTAAFKVTMQAKRELGASQKELASTAIEFTRSAQTLFPDSELAAEMSEKYKVSKQVEGVPLIAILPINDDRLTRKPPANSTPPATQQLRDRLRTPAEEVANFTVK